MRKIPLLSGQEVVKIFKRLGWEVARRRGSHIILVSQRGQIFIIDRIAVFLIFSFSFLVNKGDLLLFLLR